MSSGELEKHTNMSGVWGWGGVGEVGFHYLSHQGCCVMFEAGTETSRAIAPEACAYYGNPMAGFQRCITDLSALYENTVS